MIRKLASLYRGGPSRQDLDDCDRVVRDMGGDPKRLTAQERADLAQAIAVTRDKADPQAMMDHIGRHGTGFIAQKNRLLKKAGAHDKIYAQRGARQQARADLLAQDRPQPSPAQQAALDALAPPLRDAVTAALRSAIRFDPELRPARADDLSFCGGLPVVGGGLRWPQTVAADGSHRPCQFLGQLDLAQLPQFGLRQHFPQSGLLCFFVPSAPGDAGTKTTAPLVQHLALDGPVAEVAAPAGAPRGNAPKFPVTPALACQAPGYLSPDAAPMPVGFDSEDDNETDWEDALEQALAPFQTAQPSLQQLYLPPYGFDGFPNVWGSIARLCQGSAKMIDTAEAAALHRQDLLGQGAAPDASESQAIAQDFAGIAMMKARLAELRSAVAAHREATPVTAAQRDWFWQLWASLGAEQGAPLTGCPKRIQILNAASLMTVLIRDEALHAGVASLCRAPVELSPQAIAELSAVLRARHGGSAAFRHIQSLGCLSAIQGSESPLTALPLMQFPSSQLFDWSFGDAGAVQFWLSQEDFILQRYEAAWLEVGP